MRLRRDSLRIHRLNRWQCSIATAGIVSARPARAFSAVVYVPAKAFKITKGSPRYYSTTSEMAGHNKRGFCADCGSRLLGGGSDEGQGINASSLDDPSLFKPQMHIWTSDAQPWDHMDPTLPKFEKYPPSS